MNYQEALATTKFWDSDTEKFFAENGAPILDRALQNREEIIALCNWMEQQQIKSYLEVGIWTGRLLSALTTLFEFEKVAACDLRSAENYDFEIHLPQNTKFFDGNSRSPIFENWRAKLGHIDLILIDADHTYDAVKRDFEINAAHPHRFIALHGISGSEHVGEGVKEFWQELSGNKFEIVLPHLEINSDQPTMGIGIWSAS